MKAGGFDKIAIIYDYLVQLVFGNAVQDAQVYFLEDVSPRAKILILGGGTGWILAHLIRLKPKCEVLYIEASEKMIQLSKNKINISDCVNFIHGTENSIPPEIQFDVVITNFYVDLFLETSIDPVLMNIQKKMKPGALWLVTDFINRKKWWNTVLLRTMYRFFQITCGVEATHLLDWNQHFLSIGLVKLKSKRFWNEFIEAAVYYYPNEES